jgi:Ca-activated chloride channel family protein
MLCIGYLATLMEATFVMAVGPPPTSGTIRVESDLVLINAVVTDEHGTPVSDLDRRRFRIFEDGREQTIKYCVGEDGPVSIGLVLDTSGSMGDKLDAVKRAAIRFVDAGGPFDEYFLLTFRDSPEIVVAFTNDAVRITKTIASADAGGSTALLDGIYLGLQEVAKGRYPRRALLVISDGKENHSRYSERETRKLVQEVNYPLYAINLWQPSSSGNRYAIQRTDPGLLEEIARPTGGRTLAVRDLRKLVPTAERVAAAIRHEYVLGYVPSNHQLDGKLRHVRISIDPLNGHQLKISYRTSYTAPLQ